MNLIAKEGIFLGFMSPLGIVIGILPGALALSFARTSLLAEFVGVGPEVSGISGGIPAQDYFQNDRLSNETVKYLIESILSQAITEVGEGAVGRCLQEVEAAKEAKPGVITEGSNKFAIRFNLVQVNKKLGLEQRDWIIAICPLRRVFITDQGMDKRPVDVIEYYLGGIIGSELQ